MTTGGAAHAGGATQVGGALSAGGATQAGSPTQGGSSGSGGGSACTPGKTDPFTGLMQCQQGYRARPQAVACAVSVDVAPIGGAGGSGGDSAGEPRPRATGAEGCRDDLDCSQFELGYCAEYDTCGGFAAGGATGSCRSGCAVDADCGSGFVCLCERSTHGGQCVPGDCRVNADCGSGSACATLEAYGQLSFACTSPADECATAANCDDFSECEIDQGHRRCIETAVCGRPFLVESVARVAPVISDGAWSRRGAAPPPRVDHLTVDERAALAQHWTRLGQLEHASIAAFARFSLQLLALGAPPELVSDCTGALADETAHAVLCFRLASAYAGRDIGPGPLDIQNTLPPTSLVTILDLVIAEGCVGETRAALEAFEAADAAKDPVIANAYARIARDEQRHAELAFRFVRWALEQDPLAVRDRLAAVIAAGGADEAARGVVVPCFEELLIAKLAA
jgi:hypothetical protein